MLFIKKLVDFCLVKIRFVNLSVFVFVKWVLLIFQNQIFLNQTSCAGHIYLCFRTNKKLIFTKICLIEDRFNVWPWSWFWNPPGWPATVEPWWASTFTRTEIGLPSAGRASTAAEFRSGTWNRSWTRPRPRTRTSPSSWRKWIITKAASTAYGGRMTADFLHPPAMTSW